MKLLVLGAKGMAGHVIAEYFTAKPNFEVFQTSRAKDDVKDIYLDVSNFDAVSRLIQEIEPEVIINCIGLLNENATTKLYDAIKLNALFPHFLTNLADRFGGKVIHISTDCVFSGNEGKYTEQDQTDGMSIYAKTKALGEIHHGNHLTIRTSIIGPELKDDGIGLFLWFMKQKGEIKGYKNVYWNGVTTLELAKSIEYFIDQNICGLYHLHAPETLSKHDLLSLIQQIFHKQDVTIQPDYFLHLDRTIVDTRKELYYEVQNYPKMLQDMQKWVQAHA